MEIDRFGSVTLRSSPRWTGVIERFAESGGRQAIENAVFCSWSPTSQFRSREMPPKSLLLQAVRDRIEYRRLSLRTEQAYTSWIVRFVRYHRLRHPTTMGATEVAAYRTHLAADK